MWSKLAAHGKHFGSAFFRIKTSAPYGAEVFSLRYYRIQQLHAMWKRDDVGIVPYESARGSARRAGDCEGRPCGGAGVCARVLRIATGALRPRNDRDLHGKKVAYSGF